MTESTRTESRGGFTYTYSSSRGLVSVAPSSPSSSSSSSISSYTSGGSGSSGGGSVSQAPTQNTVTTGGKTYIVEQRGDKYVAREEGSNVWSEPSSNALAAAQSAKSVKTDVARASRENAWAFQYSKDPYTSDASGKKWTEGMLSHAATPEQAEELRLAAATGQPRPTIQSPPHEYTPVEGGVAAYPITVIPQRAGGEDEWGRPVGLVTMGTPAGLTALDTIATERAATKAATLIDVFSRGWLGSVSPLPSTEKTTSYTATGAGIGLGLGVITTAATGGIGALAIPILTVAGGWAGYGAAWGESLFQYGGAQIALMQGGGTKAYSTDSMLGGLINVPTGKATTTAEFFAHPERYPNYKIYQPVENVKLLGFAGGLVGSVAGPAVAGAVASKAAPFARSALGGINIGVEVRPGKAPLMYETNTRLMSGEVLVKTTTKSGYPVGSALYKAEKFLISPGAAQMKSSSRIAVVGKTELVKAYVENKQAGVILGRELSVSDVRSFGPGSVPQGGRELTYSQYMRFGGADVSVTKAVSVSRGKGGLLASDNTLTSRQLMPDLYEVEISGLAVKPSGLSAEVGGKVVVRTYTGTKVTNITPIRPTAPTSRGSPKTPWNLGEDVVGEVEGGVRMTMAEVTPSLDGPASFSGGMSFPSVYSAARSRVIVEEYVPLNVPPGFEGPVGVYSSSLTMSSPLSPSLSSTTWALVKPEPAVVPLVGTKMPKSGSGEIIGGMRPRATAVIPTTDIGVGRGAGVIPQLDTGLGGEVGSDTKIIHEVVPVEIPATVTLPGSGSFSGFNFKPPDITITPGGGIGGGFAMPKLGDDPFRGSGFGTSRKGARDKKRPNPMANLFQVFEYEGRTGREFAHPSGLKAEAAFAGSLATGTDFFARGYGKGKSSRKTSAKGFTLGIGKASKSKKSKRFKLW